MFDIKNIGVYFIHYKSIIREKKYSKSVSDTFKSRRPGLTNLVKRPIVRLKQQMCRVFGSIALDIDIEIIRYTHVTNIISHMENIFH